MYIAVAGPIALVSAGLKIDGCCRLELLLKLKPGTEGVG